VKLAAIEPVAGSARPPITRDYARKVVRHMFEARGMPSERVEALLQRQEPAIEYVWSPAHNHDSESKMILAPNWAMGSELMVDAHTGKVWRND
jgi:hypothetical protein